MQVVIGDRVIVVEPKMAEQIKIAQRKLAIRDARVLNDLRKSGELPRVRSNQFAGWLGDPELRKRPVLVRDTGIYHYDKATRTEAQWQEYLQIQNGGK
jgi:hypothetical protein